MAYLNWRSAPLESFEQKVEVVSDRHFEMHFIIPHAAALALLEPLTDVFSGEQNPANRPELRVDLPQNWALFWKLRDGESRLLIAHPQEDEWVATLALGQEHAKAWITALSGAKPGDRLDLRTVASAGSVGALSNLDLFISIASG